MTTAKHILALTILCAVVFTAGITNHGVTNWQEAQRLAVAREMQQRGDWILPTINGQPYLAKPPVIYWSQLALAKIRNAPVDLIDLRLTAAIAGLLGVIATYLATRIILAPSPSSAPSAPSPPGKVSAKLTEGGERSEPHHTTTNQPHTSPPSVPPCLRASVPSPPTPLLAALCLATGILYVRSSRIGEIDIILVPFVVIAIAAVTAAWRRHLDRATTHWPALVIATAATTAAILTKGPPAVLVIALAAYGGIALHHATSREPMDTRLFTLGRPDANPGFAHPRLRTMLATFVGFAAFVLASRTSNEPAQWIGVALITLACAAATHAFAGLLTRNRLRALLVSYHRTHPVGVLAIPAAALWVWATAAARRAEQLTDTNAGDAFLRGEISDNLRLFIADAPLNNLEAASYGVGAGSIAAIIAVIWIFKDKPTIRPTWLIVFAWCGLSLLAFSTLGKGVGRYLTPVWPGIAIFGAMFLTAAIHNARRPAHMRNTFIAVTLALAIGQTWWYGWGRERSHAHRSPRDFVRELLASDNVDPTRIASMDFYTPAVDIYVGHRVQPIGISTNRPEMMGQRPWTLDQLRAELDATNNPITILVPDRPRQANQPTAQQRLTDAGIAVTPINTTQRFTIEHARFNIQALQAQ